MEDILKTLYGNFYSKPQNTPQARRIEANHRILIDHLSKADRRLVLRIIDDKDQPIHDISFDSFVSGFCLAWRLANELSQYGKRKFSVMKGGFMIYITGDTHGNFSRVVSLCEKIHTSAEDVLIILGDAGINGFGKEQDRRLKRVLSRLPITLFCIHGNHEERPQNIPGYAETLWRGGTVFVEPEFPHLLFAKDGEIYDFGGKRCLVIGGAYSVDKYYRLARGRRWWTDEQPSAEIKARVEKCLEKENWRIDIVLTHTCPLQYEPTEVFLPGIDQSTVDKSTEEWLGTIERRLSYEKWYCGHYHTSKQVDQLVFMFQDICAFPSDG